MNLYIVETLYSLSRRKYKKNNYLSKYNIDTIVYMYLLFNSETSKYRTLSVTEFEFTIKRVQFIDSVYFVPKKRPLFGGVR